MGSQGNTLTFESDRHWQATVNIKEGGVFFLMRGEPAGEFAGKFLLYREDWDFERDCNPHGYALEEIQRLFSLGRLVLIRGFVP